jgi:formate C-acetyltransferase
MGSSALVEERQMKHQDKITAVDRIATLRTRCRQRKAQRWVDTAIVDHRSFLASERLASHTLRMGRRTRDRLAQFRFAVDDMELLVGRPAPPADVEEAEHKEAKEYLSRVPYTWTPGQTGHCELDRRLVFEHGVDGALKMLTERKNAEQDPTRRDTFESFILAMEGFQVFILNAERVARDAIPAAGVQRRGELEEMARICARCAHLPPQTFREALQLAWFVDLAASFADNGGLINPGHLDRTLAEWYRRDVDGGVLSRDDALTLVECFYILINDYVPDGLAIAVMVGGVDVNGHDLTNDLSYVCMEALQRTNLAYPTVGVCWHDKTPSDLVDLTVGLIADGFTTPAFFNDGTIQTGLRKYGVPPSESWNYINSTCVEITPVGSSNVWVASPYFSVCAILNEEIRAIAEGGRAPATFDDFLRSYLARLGAAIAEGVRRENESRARRQRYGRKPFQSVFTNDCVQRGTDIDDGGAKYNWIECSFVGLANLTDSLQVIRKEIFEAKAMDFPELNGILTSNFAGAERIHNRFLLSHEKYGQGNAAADALFGRLVDFVVAECATHRIAPGGTHFVPGAFCWVMHERLGRECGATPDGRLAGVPFADGCGPAQGRETRGPTAAILSTTSWDASPLIGGAAFNMKFSKSLFRDNETRKRLRDLIVTFLARGGFEVQINVVDNAILRQARAEPDRYRDLVVRIGGYTDYFVRLSPEMQDEVILRTEYTAV